MIILFWIISSLVYGSTVTIAKPLNKKALSKALFIKRIYIGEGRSQRELRFVCVTPSFWLLIVYDMGESCSGHFHLDFFVLPLNLTWIICDVKGKRGVSQSLVEFIPWVWEK